ncbi:MAG: flagellar biosynthesis protein FlhA [Desulfohalobiaceae bacterium]|nr:flagellar biosynthesis protein FlhA [Desulfohalobiaceae bacterium]
MNFAPAWKNWSHILLRGDIAASLGMVIILLLMIIPLPPFLLDIFLSLNITTALLILIISLYTSHSLEFAIFPTVLLATTLFRLSLNVASTRLILLHGDTGPMAAGKVIYSFGQFVVGGDYVVGIVIFVILVAINFIVITKGASRVAEVSARFTLDAMPGKQMAIDADLNAGSISEEEARRRREEISQESDFFGAMDGASKFVRGDAIAGIVITFVNICAGFVIGVMQQGMSLVEAAQNYTILTIGDGLVSQIPALIISTAAGMLVSRTGGTSDLGSELSKQLTFKPRAIWVVSGILLLFAIIPGLPFLPFLFLSLVLGALGFSLTRKQKRVKETSEEEEVPQQVQQEENYEDMLTVDLLELEVGYGLVPFVDASQNGELLDRIRSIRKQFVQSHGLIIPPIHIKDNLQLNPNQYALHLKGVRIATAEIMPGHFLAMDPGTASEKMEGTETTEPAFGLPALWVAEEKKERAQIAGYTVVDCTTVMATHLSELIKRHAHELLGRQEVQNLLDTTAKSYPKLVEELVPNLMSLGGVMRVLQNLLREEVSIRDMRTILETLADHAPKTQDEDLLTEYVRQALARQISNRAAGENSLLPVITLDTELEETIQKSVQYSGQGSYLALEPRTAERLLTSLSEQIKQSGSGTHPVLLCAPNIRPHVKRLTEQYLPQLPVLSYNEITPQLQIQSLGTVQINAS